MFDNENGFVRNAFYVQREENELKHRELAIPHGSKTNVFQYRLNKKGEMEIIELEHVLK